MTEFTITSDPANPLLHREGEEKPATSLNQPRVMRRRRPFVAEPAIGTSTATLSPPPRTNVDDEDLPVLTEVVSIQAAVPEQKPGDLNELQIAQLTSAITHTIEQQLANDLPGLLEAALCEATESLRAGIALSMENALRDVLSRYK